MARLTLQYVVQARRKLRGFIILLPEISERGENTVNYLRYEEAIIAYFKAQRKLREGGRYERYAYLSQLDAVVGCSCSEGGWHYMSREHLGGLEHIARLHHLEPNVFKLVMEKRDAWRARAVLRPWFKKLNFFENLMGRITRAEANNLYDQWLAEANKQEPDHYPRWRIM